MACAGADHRDFASTAGQSLGAFAVQGLRLDVIGDGNDYVGKGLSGGMITIRPSPSASYIAEQNTIIGNTVLYGATSGLLLANGQAGERFAVRNSGASAIIEGCGSNGCEYMTGGGGRYLGRTGSNFGAGMTGGMAFIYDKDGEFLSQVNPETLHISKLSTGYWKEYLEGRVALHASETDSALAKRLLNNWEVECGNFWHVVPIEVLGLLPKPVADNEIPVRSA